MAPQDRDKKKSWREIDRMRDGSRHSGSNREKKGGKKNREHSSAYVNYKSDLEKVFSGGDVPDYLKSQLPTNEKTAGRLKLLGAITRSTDDAELDAAMKAYLAENDDFPDDFDTLLRAIDYPDEAIQLMILRQLDRLQKERPVPHRSQFLLKIDSIAMLGEDDDLLELAEDLVRRLR